MDITLPSGDLTDLLRHPLVHGLMELSSDGAIVIDAESRRVLAVNGRARELLGAGDDLVGSSCCDALNSPACRHACPLSRAVRGEPQPELTTLFFRRHDDHSVVHADARMLVIRDGAGQAIAGIELLRDQREVHALERALRSRRSVLGLVGRSAAMQRLYERIERLAPCDLPVLVTGAPGVGKRRVAEALHAASRRSAGPLVVVQVDHAPPGQRVRILLDGLAQARGGSLVVAEVDGGDDALVAALLCLSRDGSVELDGRAQPLDDTRLLLTATTPPAALAGALGEATLPVPPLSERLADLPLLVADLLGHLAGPSSIEADALAVLARRSWPGNVSELGRTLAAAAVRAGDHPQLRVADLDCATAGEGVCTLADAEAIAIRRAMDETCGNVSAAARALGIDRSTLWRKLKRLEAEGGWI